VRGQRGRPGTGSWQRGVLSGQHLRRRGCDGATKATRAYKDCCPCARARERQRRDKTRRESQCTRRRVSASQARFVFRLRAQSPLRASRLGSSLAASASEGRTSAHGTPTHSHHHPPHPPATVLPSQSASCTLASTPAFTGDPSLRAQPCNNEARPLRAPEPELTTTLRLRALFFDRISFSARCASAPSASVAPQAQQLLRHPFYTP
jgi:hypothetical protein